MIDRVRLIDFQRHQRLTLQLDRVTTLVGPSDRGKSAVLRALRWVLENVPQGASFVREGATACEVAVRVDGRTVVRRRSAKENVYELDGEAFRSLRAVSVPDSIAAVLNLHSASFQGQLDPPFWLSETAGEVARRLNEVVNLQEIDDVLGRAAADLRQTRAEAGVAETRLAEAVRRRDASAWAADAKAEVDALADQAAAWEKQRDAAGRLAIDVMRLHAAVDEQTEADAAWRAGEAVVDLGAAVVQTAASASTLRQLLDEAARAEAAVEAWDAVGPGWAALSRLRSEADASAAARGELSAMLEQLEQEERACRELDDRLAELEAELAAATQGLCPLCGQPAAPSQFCSPTSTSPTDPQSLVRRPVRSGTPSRPGT